MALQLILVVDDSPAIRETVSILLGGAYAVRTLNFGERDLPAQLGQQPLPRVIVAGWGEAAAAIVDQFPAQTPVLWLLDNQDEHPRSPSGVWESLPRRFSPFELRRRVDHLAAHTPNAHPLDRARRRLRSPYVPEEAARMLAQASGQDLPISLFGEAGTGKRSVARALHAVRGGGEFLTSRGPGFDVDFFRHRSRHGTIFLTDVDQLADAGQQSLLAWMEAYDPKVRPAGSHLRLVTATTRPLSDRLEEGGFSRELYHRLTVLSVDLPPLRQRTAELPALVRELTREVATTMGVAPPTFTRTALDRLCHYLWFGNIAELEAVLGRTLSVHRHAAIDAGDLLFDTTRWQGGSPASAAPPVANAKPNGTNRQTLDLVINELAHEFKNPMVTIKTFAQHLRRALRDGGDEEQFARLTGDAVDQMDEVLENLLRFTRFGPGAAEVTELHGLLTAALDSVRDLPTPPSCRIECTPGPTVQVVADREQLIYALTNLLRSLTRGLQPQDVLTIRPQPSGEIVIDLAPACEPVSRRLTRMLDEPNSAEDPLPLGIAVASALMERNRGTLAFDFHSQPAKVTITLPLAEAQETPRADK